MGSSTDDENINDCHMKADIYFHWVYKSNKVNVLVFLDVFYCFLSKIELDQIILHVLWIPTGSLSTYQLSIMEQFHKSANCKHFYSLCSFFISQKINSCVFSSTYRWPIYIVIPETVCLEFMLATSQQCWTFPNSFFFSFFFCLQAGRKHYSFC